MSFGLMLVTDPAVPSLVETVRAALEGAPRGRVAVQARAKGASARALSELSAALLPICRAAGAPLVVNDRADVAHAIGADGVQLPEDSLHVSQARAVLGPHALVGCSCHDRGGLERAALEDASYALLAPIGLVPEKGTPLGVEGFARAVAGLPLPVFALGGVTPALAPSLRRAGAAGLAVSRAVLLATDPSAAVRALLAP
jgi:thiamine-phosphate pyrophosphorylase